MPTRDMPQRIKPIARLCSGHPGVKTHPAAMKPLPLPATLALAVVCAIIGFAIGRLGTLDPGGAASAASPGGNLMEPGFDSSPGRSSGAAVSSEKEPVAESAASLLPTAGRGDPVTRLEAAMQGGSQFSRIIRMLLVTSQLREEEIPGILAFAAGRPDEERDITRIGALARWAELDPQAAAEFTRTGTGSDRNAGPMMEMTLGEWAAHDAVAARAWLEQLTDPDQREHALKGFLGGLAIRDPAAALREVGALPPGSQTGMYASVFNAWARRSPALAAVQAAQLPDPENRRRAIESVLSVWSQRAPQEALGWTLRQGDPKEQRSLAGDVLERWAASDPQAALAATIGLAADLRDEIAARVVGSAVRKDLEEARSFAGRLPPGQARDQAMQRIGAFMAERDPGAAADFARGLPAGPARQALLGDVARVWSQRDPPAAAAWVAQFPEDGGRARAAGDIVGKWAKTDAASAAKWIERLPQGASRDSAAAAYAREVRNVDPEGAMAWASTVADQVQREKLAAEVLGTWRGKDRAAANAWLEKTRTIGDDLRSVLRRMP
jgi:hypothetical protein